MWHFHTELKDVFFYTDFQIEIKENALFFVSDQWVEKNILELLFVCQQFSAHFEQNLHS